MCPGDDGRADLAGDRDSAQQDAELANLLEDLEAEHGTPQPVLFEPPKRPREDRRPLVSYADLDATSDGSGLCSTTTATLTIAKEATKETTRCCSESEFNGQGRREQ